MNWKALLSLFLLIFTWELQAGVGESVDQIRSRWGAGKEVGEHQIVFTVENFDVTVMFEKGISVREIYTTHLWNNNETRQMTASEIQKLLDLQAPGKSWSKLEEESDGRVLWLSADGKIYARLLPKFNSLTFAPGLKELPKS